MTDPVQQPDQAPVPPRDPAQRAQNPGDPAPHDPAPHEAAAPDYAQPQHPLSHPGPGSPPPRQPVLSIISMISGILGVVIGFVGWGLLFSIAAVVLGHLGQRRERDAKGFWITGLVTGYVGILVNLVVIVIWVVFLIALASTGDWNWNNYRDFSDMR